MTKESELMSRDANLVKQESSFALVAAKGPLAGRRFALRCGKNSVGRAVANDVTLPDNKVSRQHAAIEVADGGVKVTDLESANGVYVNGNRVSEARVSEGDEVQIGDSAFQLLPLRAATDTSVRAVAETEIDYEPDVGEATDLARALVFDDPFEISNELPEVVAEVRPEDVKFSRPTVSTARKDEAESELRRILSFVVSRATNANRCGILLRDPQSGAFQVAMVGVSASPNRISQRVVNHVAERKIGVWGDVAVRVDGERKEKREVICVPFCAHGQVLGMIYLDSDSPASADKKPEAAAKTLIQRGRKFDVSLLHLVQMVAEQAAPWLEVFEAPEDDAELQIDDQAIGRAFVDLSHYVKNVFQSLGGGAYLLDRGVSDQKWDAVQMGWQMVRNNQDRLSELFLNLVDLARPQKPGYRLQELDAVLEDVVRQKVGFLDPPNVQLIVHAVENPQSVMLDGGMMSRAIGNVVTFLLENRPSDTAQTIEIEPVFESASVQVVVRDDAVQFSDKEKASLFNLHGEPIGNKSGVLGLVVAKKFVREHNGSIAADTRASHEEPGLTFTIRIPVRPSSHA